MCIPNIGVAFDEDEVAASLDVEGVDKDVAQNAADPLLLSEVCAWHRGTDNGVIVGDDRSK